MMTDTNNPKAVCETGQDYKSFEYEVADSAMFEYARIDDALLAQLAEQTGYYTENGTLLKLAQAIWVTGAEYQRERDARLCESVLASGPKLAATIRGRA